MQGWISLHRQIQHHWLWEDKPFSKGQAWIDLLLLANHEDSKFLLGNSIVSAKRGEVITSELKLMSRWGWSKTKVRSFLGLLEKDGMIEKNSDNKKTALKILNYEDWQDVKTAKEPQKNRTETEQRPQKDTINNDNNDNNDNKYKYYLREIENFRQRYSPETLTLIDKYLDILRTTRVSGKIADSVVCKIYEEMNKYPEIVIQYSCYTVVNNPSLHSKKENYFFGIMRNTKSEEAEYKLNKGSKEQSSGNIFLDMLRKEGKMQ